MVNKIHPPDAPVCRSSKDLLFERRPHSNDANPPPSSRSSSIFLLTGHFRLLMALAWYCSTLLLTTVVLVRGDYDEEFCKTKVAGIQGINYTDWVLNIPNDGMLVSEIKTRNRTSSVNVHYYSHALQLIKTVSTTAKGTTFYYTDASFGDREGFFSNSTCNVVKPTNQNDFKHMLTKLGSHSYRMAPANSMVEWYPSSTIQIKFRVLKEYSTYRGIPTSHWFTCNYDTVNDKTAVIEWMITDYRNISVVGNPSPRFPLLKKSTYADNTTHVVLYSMNEAIDPTKLKTVMARPKNSWCRNEKPRKPLPKLPSYMAFTGELTIMRNGETTVSFRKKIYDFDNELYFTYRLDNPESEENNEKDIDIKINDINTGIHYVIQPNAANCATRRRVILDFVDVAFSEGSIIARYLQQLLGPDYPTYKYTGQRLVRGFECDTWIARMMWERWNHTYAWSFMTTAQMKKLNYTEDAWRVPVAFETFQKNVYTMYNIFSYRTEKKEVQLPVNIDLCYGFESPIIVRMIVDVRYDDIIQNIGINSFKRAFLTSVQVMGHMRTPMRISNIEVFANQKNDNETFAQFRLLPRDVPGTVFEADNDTLETDEVLKLLRKIIDVGRLVVGVSYSNSKYRLLVVKEGTMEVLDNQTYGGISSELTGSGVGYSGGSMAGIAFGMIFLGLIIGVGAVYGFKRYKNSIAIDSNFSMSNLQEKADEEMEN